MTVNDFIEKYMHLLTNFHPELNQSENLERQLSCGIIDRELTLQKFKYNFEGLLKLLKRSYTQCKQCEK